MLGAAGSCIGFLVSLAFVAVGASVVRAAKPMSGYLMVAAGLLELVTVCCVAGFSSEAARVALIDSGVDADAQMILHLVVGAASMLVDVIVGVLLVVSVVGLAKAVREAKPG
jgi:hypothetical protein